jgi:hypothetical protein
MNTTTASTALDGVRPVTLSASGTTWLKFAIVYLLLGVAMGIGMGASENFTLRPVHAHVNLLGWTTMALAGLVYTVFPKAAASKLAKVHFWMMNLALPVMMGSLSFYLLTGDKSVVPALALSEFVAAGGIICFAINIFTNLKQD